jgi:site-specific DNA-methyltransferase (adenine-specific)
MKPEEVNGDCICCGAGDHILWKYNFDVYTSRKYASSHYHILFYEKPGGRRTFNLERR